MPMQLQGAQRARAQRFIVPSFLFLAACAAPAPSPLEPDELSLAVGARGVDPAHLAQALAAARLEPLAVPVPTGAFDDARTPGARPDADAPELWHASAFAFEARTRAARHALIAARAQARSAGAPMPARAMVEVEELDRPDARVRMTLTFDLLGILGLGPAAAARELADARVRRALGELELAVWGARVEVDRARARLATVRAQTAALEELAGEARSARARIEILERTGRLASQAVSAARIAQERLGVLLAVLEAEGADARAALAVAAGIAQESSWLDDLGPATLAGMEGAAGAEGAVDTELPPRGELLQRSPELRLALVDHALAEARLREAAAARWPTLELGPHLLWAMDELLLGVIGGSAIPWPGSVDGPLAAALEERDAARSALEDALLATQARARAAGERLVAARRARDEHAAALEVESAIAWRAARSLFAVEPGALMEWAAALSMRAEALVELQRARLATIEARLDLERALGPVGASDPVRVPGTLPREGSSGLARAEGSR